VAKRPEDDILTKTYQSYKAQQEGIAPEDMDAYMAMENRKKEETAYMASNPQLVLRQGKFQETSGEFIQFKRQNITKWGGLS